jgi:hypothetical protein
MPKQSLIVDIPFGFDEQTVSSAALNDVILDATQVAKEIQARGNDPDQMGAAFVLNAIKMSSIFLLLEKYFLAGGPLPWCWSPDRVYLLQKQHEARESLRGPKRNT